MKNQNLTQKFEQKTKKIIQNFELNEKRGNRQYYKNTCSYDLLEEKGWQFSNDYDLYAELEKQEYERREYESFATQNYLKKLRMVIKNNLHKFTPYQQTIIKLRFYKNLSIADLAERFKVSKGAMQSYLSRIQAKISKFLK